MIDLNGKQFEGTAIFNGGNAGLAENVTLAVTKRQVSEPENYPNYKLVVKDEAGSEVSQGFYVFKPQAGKTDEQNQTRENQEISRLIHLGRAVMGPEFEFPQVNSMQEAYDAIFGIVTDNAPGNKYNVFVTYGTARKPSKYLGIRYFDFIEPTSGVSKLRVRNSDNMERVVPDAAFNGATTNTSTLDSAPKKVDFLADM